MDRFGRAPRRGKVEKLGRSPGRSEEDKGSRLNMSVPAFTGGNDQSLSSKRQMDLKNESEADTLSIAKDRGQVTMTSAMSMTNIALLKAVLDRGPENNQFYTILLVLTSLALGLQILAGILSLCVSQLRNYYQKFSDNIGQTVQCCPIGFVWRSHQEKEKEETPDTCCPCRLEIVSQYYSNHELSVIDAWKDWVEEDTEHDMNAVEAEIMITYLDDVISVAREKLEKLGDKRKDMDDQEYTTQVNALKEEIDRAFLRKSLYTKSKCKAEVTNAQGNILSVAMHDIMRNHTLKRAQTWQYVINLMLYTAFIISAFLTGLGLAS